MIPQGTRPAKTSDLERLLARNVAEMEFEAKALKAFEELEVVTLKDLVRLTEKDLMSVKNFGQKSIEKVTGLLAKLDLTLGMNV